MPHRKALGEALSYLGSGQLIGGGILWGQATSASQSFYGMVISICGLVTLALPYIFKELDRRRDERGVSRKLKEAEAKLAAAEAGLKSLETDQVQPNTVSIAAVNGTLAALRDQLVRAAFVKSSPSTDSMPTIKPALLVEDDPDAARPMAEVLTTAFYEVKVAATLADALAALPKHPYRLVLLDLGLPDGDGLEVLRAIRRARLDCRIIVTTGYSDDARLDRVRSYLTGRDRLMVKPVDFHALMAAVLPPTPEAPR